MAKENTKYYSNKIIGVKFLLIACSISYILYKLLQQTETINYTSVISKFSPLFIIPIAILSITNIWLESYKWKKLTSNFHKQKDSDSFISILYGISLGIFTPYRLGDYIGRLIHIPKDKIKQGLKTCIYNSFGLLITNIIFGYIGLAFLLSTDKISTQFQIPNRWIIISLLIAVLTSLFVFLKIDIILNRLSKVINRKYFTTKNIIIKSPFRILLINTLKIISFQHQYILLLFAFGLSPNYINTIFAISASYLIISISPGTIIGDLGIRNAAGIMFLGLLGIPTHIILASSMLIWIINLALPALVGNILLGNSATKPTKQLQIKEISKLITKRQP